MLKITSKGHKSKQKILEAAHELFLEYGFEKTTIRKICEESELSIGTFYHFFSSKNEILYEFLKSEEETLLEQLQLMEHQSVLNKIESIIKLKFDYIKDHSKSLLKNIIADIIVNSKENNILFTFKFKTMLEELINEGVENEEFTINLPANQIADYIHTAILGYMVLWVSSYDLNCLTDISNEHDRSEIDHYHTLVHSLFFNLINIKK